MAGAYTAVLEDVYRAARYREARHEQCTEATRSALDRATALEAKLAETQAARAPLEGRLAELHLALARHSAAPETPSTARHAPEVSQAAAADPPLSPPADAVQAACARARNVLLGTLGHASSRTSSQAARLVSLRSHRLALQHRYAAVEKRLQATIAARQEIAERLGATQT